MKFEEVLPALREGKRVGRMSWGYSMYLAIHEDEELPPGIPSGPWIATYALRPIGKVGFVYRQVPWLNSTYDLLAQDWIIHKEEEDESRS